MKNITKINIIKMYLIYINLFSNGYNIRVKIKYIKLSAVEQCKAINVSKI